MRQVQERDLVTMHYEGKLENGEVFEGSQDAAPVSIQLGKEQILPSLERALLGMEPGQTRALSIPPEEGYGPHYPELVLTVKRESLGREDLALEMVVAMNMERDGQTHRLPAMITAIEGDQVTVDFNHPLAGKELFYTITLVDAKPEQESP